MRILLIDIDTLRPDHLGCYGYHRDTSPAIDRVARRGTRFENVYCSDAPCLPSRTALVTGKHGIHSGVVGHGGSAAEVRSEGAARKFSDRLKRESMPALLRWAGYHTCFIGAFAERHASWTFLAGFMETHNSGGGGKDIADAVTPLARDWLDRHGREDDWFVHLNYWDVHATYRTPMEFGDPFADSPPPDWLTEEIVQEHRQTAGHRTARDLIGGNAAAYPRMPGEVRDLSDARKLFDGYDTAIRYVDRDLGELFAMLERQGVWEDTAVIITSDHGENMGELATYCEHDTASHSVCNIPLIIKWPGGKEGHVDKGLHYHLDLPATLDALLGLRERAVARLGYDIPPDWDSRSFAHAVTEGLDCGREDLVIGQCAHVCQRAVRWDSYMYTFTYHDGYKLFPGEMLFDIETDPHQLNNLAVERPDLCREAVYRLHRWHTDMMRTMPAGVASDPLWTVMQEGGPRQCMHFEKRADQFFAGLRRTGRGHLIEEFVRRHPDLEHAARKARKADHDR